MNKSQVHTGFYYLIKNTIRMFMEFTGSMTFQRLKSNFRTKMSLKAVTLKLKAISLQLKFI